MIENLVLLPCHAIYKGRGDGTSFDDWYMEDFQKEGHDNLSWIKQIEKCIQLIDEKTLVIISGGKTKKVGNISESFSYLNLVLQNKEKFLVGRSEDKIINSIYLEEFAKDSFENLLFSICRFHEVTQRYPCKITVVGYNFKRKRFLEAHSAAIGYPRARIEYIGIDPKPDYAADSEQLAKFYKDLDYFEYKNALSLFEKCPLGDSGELLAKKTKRNPYRVFESYKLSNPELFAHVFNKAGTFSWEM